MGLIWSFFWPSKKDGDDADDAAPTTNAAGVEVDEVVDPVTGLTPSGKQSIIDTWDLVRRDLKSVAIQFFLKLFVVHPEYKPMFKAFADVPDDQLADNRRFQAHAINVLTNINMLIDSLNDVECLVEHLQTIKERHVPRKVTAIHFQNTLAVLQDFLESALGDKMTAKARQSWNVLFQVMNTVFQD